MMLLRSNRALLVSSAAVLALVAAPVAAYAQVTYEFNLPAQPLADALRAVGSRARVNVAFDPATTRGLRAPALKGAYSAEGALKQLTDSSGLIVRVTPGGSFLVEVAAASRADGSRSDIGAGEGTLLPELLVQGSSSLNTDVRRTEDDILPYVVFGRQEIQQSQAANVEDFLRTRLPMATDRGTASTNDPVNNVSGNRSSINLRGLGANQTLILVNGRRAPGVLPGFGADPAQPDVNGIPIAAIERIEVLPGTASGIYGGGATGGVINIILRKDYSGTELRLTYDNTFDTDSARRRVDLSTGFSLEGGRTQVMITGSYSDGNDLLAMDRDFIEPARRRAYRNAPDLVAELNLSSNRTNFRSAFGTPLTLLNGTPFGSTYGSVPANYAGGDAGAGLLAGAGTLDITIPDGPTGRRQSLSAVPENQAVNLTIRRDMTDSIQAYLDVSATKSLSTSRRGFPGGTILLFPGSGNPFQDFLYVSLPAADLDTDTATESTTVRVNGGVIIDLSHGWTAGLDANWNRATNAYTTDNRRLDASLITSAVTSGQINLFRDLDLFPITYSNYLRQAEVEFPTAPTYTRDYTARVAGPLFSLPAGQVRMTGLISRREDQAPDILRDYGPASSQRYEYYRARSQVANSVYVETVVPLFSDAQDFTLLYSLEAQLSARWDRYETTSSPAVRFATLGGPKPASTEVTTTLESTDYTVGLKYQPFADLSIRASYSTGFLPPSLTQLLGFSTQSTNIYRDPLRGNTRAFNQLTLRSGGNPDAEPEESISQSIGFIYTPSFLSGLRISADFVRIDKTDELTSLDALTILQNEALFPNRVTRGQNLPGDQPGWAGVITAIDISLLNAAKTRVEATDIQIDYARDVGNFGWFRVYAVGTIQDTMARQLLSSLPTINRVGFSDGPGKLRFNAGVDWQRGPWALSLNTRYFDDYKVFSSTDVALGQQRTSRIQGASSIPSQTYTDISGRYVFDSGLMAGGEISVGIRNVFNQSPPLVATADPMGGYSTFGDPRLRTYSISIRKAF